MKDDIKEILISENQIQQKVKELGRQISKDYEGKELLLIGVLKGAVMFIGDLMKQITVQVKVDFMDVSSYGSSTETSGVVRINKDLDESIEGKHVMIVEDIIDSGLTLKYLTTILQSRKPASLKICSLLDKPERRKVDIKIDYKGFSIPDEFVVGYGLDYNECYRNLPFICVLKPSVYNA
ncbi:MAG: hypoxanthine phosphoribosyltransferase [Thermosediminibacterales bacterium]|nr:hypoxanthine phosphoribosyltransferase [Thermosediminibacterales bacterium]MDK2836134.1 hypoxanthine phosphoribosyltransferase [Thermosediminibacterales bacterium]